MTDEADELTRDELHAAALAACRALVDTIEATGGIVRYVDEQGSILAEAPVADEDWVDLADAYVKACYALKRPTKMTEVSNDG